MPINKSIMQTLLAWGWGDLQKRGQNDWKSRKPDGEVAHVEFQQYGSLNETGIMSTSIAMPTWMGEISQGLTPQRTTGNHWVLREQMFSSDEPPYPGSKYMHVQVVLTGHSKFNQWIDGQKHGIIAERSWIWGNFEDMGGVEGGRGNVNTILSCEIFMFLFHTPPPPTRKCFAWDHPGFSTVLTAYC